MTKEQCIKYLNYYKEKGMTKQYEDMKKHILTTRKFTPEERKALFPSKEKVVNDN